MSVPSSSSAPLDSSLDSVSPFTSLRSLQFHHLSRLFRPDSSDSSNSSNLWFGQWKILIYDDDGQAILSPLFSVSELRRLGVTLHLPLSAARESVPDVPAIYFVKASQANISKLSSDVIRGLYTQYAVHFTTSIPRSLLENLAQSTAESGASSRVASIRDEYSQFICLEDELFISNHHNSLIQLNNPALPESELFAFIDSVVDSLFSVFATIGLVPIIRAKPGNAAEIVATRLDQKLREHLTNRNNLFSAPSSSSSLHRPVLLLLDRQFDFSTPLHHPWTYQALLNDLLGLKSNRVSVQVENQGEAGGAGKKNMKTYDLSSSEDKFWRDTAGKPFPQVAESVQAKLENYQAEIAVIQKKPAAGAAAPAARTYDDSGSSDGDLLHAISALPKMQKKKRMLDQHVNIATALLREIKARDIDCFFEIEEGFLAKSALSLAELGKLLGNEKETPKGSAKDRIRALCIWFMQQEEIPDEATVDALKKAIITAPNENSTANGGSASSADSVAMLSALEFLKQWRFLHRLSSGQVKNNRSAPSMSSDPASAGWSMIGKFAEKMVTQTAGVLAGVRNLIPASEELPISRALDAIINRPESEEAAQFIQLDPKASKKMPGQSRSVQPVKEAVVFVLGGGSYCEFENVQEFRRKHAATGLNSCIYGSTELVAPEQFLKQLATLGEKQKQSAGSSSLPVD